MTATRRPRSSSGSEAPAPTRRRYRYFTRSRAKRDAKLGANQEGRINTLSDQEHRNRINLLKPTPMDTTPSKALGIENIDFNIEENGKDHFTDEYELPDLVVRRGQPFKVSINFDRNVDLDDDLVVFQLAFGSRPQVSKGTLLRFALNIMDTTQIARTGLGKWSAQVSSIVDKTVTFMLNSPPNALVGKYGVFIESSLQNQADTTRRFEMEDDEIYLLFNPWCKDDLVYMEDSKERNEYILNEKGRIWVGSAWNNSGKPWNFGQFDNPVLDAALELMERGEVGDSARRSPIAFVRTISAQANSMDDDGLLEGRWTEEFPKDCVLPWTWTGSVKICKQFMETGKPVQYGQCWVFSGLVTSLLRSLGIPTRSVSNFESAHDTDSSMTIDSHFDEDDEPVTHLDDSIWNFHVWNESWFNRLDLPKGYGGWQAHDATPQESSEGVMRCGPASLKAIKNGEVYMNYDVPFIFSEVNGDRVNWKVDKNGDMKAIDIDTHSVGRKISTKAVGSNHRHDLTLDYKYPENSEDERRVVEFVHKFSSRAEHDIYDRESHDVKFELVLPETANLGDDFQVRASVKNMSDGVRSIYGRLTILSSFYTGIPGKRIKGEMFQLKVDPKSDAMLSLAVTKEDYFKKLNPEASMKVYVSLHVTETEQHFANTRAFTLEKPFLNLKVADEVYAKVNSTGTVSFTNPLTVDLTNGLINLEGGSIMSADTFTFENPIKPGESVSKEFTICPRRSGDKEIQATFTSDQLSGVDGSVEFRVRYSS